MTRVPIQEILHPVCETLQLPKKPSIPVVEDIRVAAFHGLTLLDLQNIIHNFTMDGAILQDHYLIGDADNEHCFELWKKNSDQSPEMTQYLKDLEIYEQAHKELKRVATRRKEFMAQCREIFKKNGIRTIENRIGFLQNTAGSPQQLSELDNLKSKHKALTDIRDFCIQDPKSLMEILNTLNKE